MTISQALVLAMMFPAVVAPAAASPRADDAIVVRFGTFMPDGGGIWDENEIDFTLTAGDFDHATLGVGFVSGLGRHVEVSLFADFYGETVLSQYRDYVDADDRAIFHDTRLHMTPVVVDVRILPGGRYRARAGGRAVSKPVWYLGGGVGANFWEYQEVGDFIDFFDPTLPIFFERYKDDGVALSLHALAGFELPVGPRSNVVFEGRYLWSDDDLGDRFGHLAASRPVDIDRKLVMDGLALTAGVAFRF